MDAPRRAALFTNGRNQAILIPRDFELPGKEALIRKEGDRLIIEPVPPPGLLALLATLEPIDQTFPDIGYTPFEPFDEPADRCYGEIGRALERADTPIGANDLLIAALALGLILITANESEFRCVPGLVVENWLDD